MTIGEQMRRAGGFTSGFDYMRLVLATMVVFNHSFGMGGGSMADLGLPFEFHRIFGHAILPMFFALSGFLVAASLLRTPNLGVFMGLRALRILPALMVEIALSALILGPLLTTVAWRDYFTDPDFFRYFLNMLGWIHYHLPGVFVDNPVPRTVNGSLWTVPYEAECYIVLALVALLGLVRRPALFLGLLALACVALIVWNAAHGDPDPSRGTLTGRQLILFFLAGVLLHLGRDRVPSSGWLALAAGGLSLALVASHVWVYLLPLPVAYVTAWLGLQQPRKLPLLFTGDYSYGIYLYAYPIQQAVVQMLPDGRVWYVNFAVSMVVVGCFAAFSWHCIEKPTLKLKRLLARRAGAQAPDTGAASEAAPIAGQPAQA